ncbi:16S rRNA (guanine(966)-N(2))-methyltransferase RsmD [Macrococcus hajekii]|uniref:16S rRNA (Guanine(966)-N(2))-methyltransferase RsmD n=1 Tax=Macrococcus hajekii TaxID=198482 RepID=A0A4R6BN66_9STAP|nr:16S rRNA (guanine(966)-N(2))-methyltransferase RsmD [Macrococcus hajekii]TDM03290.1 16S rRNA (guanine(966)-N(2))-methyltransferase RsmD [Macrococcus hajekii]GGA97629.1 methyltransferase [Macrococcus hajekii]
MRVIAGKYKKKKIEAAPGMTSRPTTDKIKENIFNILGPLEGHGLDLFAGSGGLGIEALSRGLESAVFVDGSKEAVTAIRHNIDGIDEHVEVYRNDAFRALKALKKREQQFDLIILDPPYNKGLLNKAIEQIDSYGLLKAEGRLMCECGKDETVNPLTYDIMKEEIYGTIKITILKGVQHDD